MPRIAQRVVSFLANRKVAYTALSVIAAFVILNSVVLPWYVNHGETSHVPNVLGLSLDSAKQTLQASGLVPIESDKRPDPQAPAGTVVSQNPDVDAVVKSGRRVYLTISGGEVLVIVPALRGRSVRDAKFTLEHTGLRIGDVEYAASDAYPENTIVEQSIQPGMKVSKSTPVKIIVSRGKELQQITVQDFTGKTLTEAERLILQQGLKLGNITLQASFDLIPNTVVDQFPRAGESVMAGQAVDLFVIKAGKPKEEFQHPKN
jgi:serine/threonine-protein kinase